eukprot:TRINITY_DN8015_c0_g1_i2.p1 TRINITY_DN8015_c0_g1~~TRINITY_DN8015_c0_g1_i2.p1  ORF type:complete len:294 (+),score=29.72 TRINITY_DN8015_c0_g1_i2:74-955(+)
MAAALTASASSAQLLRRSSNKTSNADCTAPPARSAHGRQKVTRSRSDGAAKGNHRLSHVPNRAAAAAASLMRVASVPRGLPHGISMPGQHTVPKPVHLISHQHFHYHIHGPSNSASPSAGSAAAAARVDPATGAKAETSSEAAAAAAVPDPMPFLQRAVSASAAAASGEPGGDGRLPAESARSTFFRTGSDSLAEAVPVSLSASGYVTFFGKMSPTTTQQPQAELHGSLPAGSASPLKLSGALRLRDTGTCLPPAARGLDLPPPQRSPELTKRSGPTSSRKPQPEPAAELSPT